MRRVVVICVFLGAAAPVAGAVAASPPLLPMVGQFIPTSQGVPAAIRLSGRLPTTAAGERVTILGRDCVTGVDRHVKDTQSRSGGGWEVTLGGSFGRAGEFDVGIAYRARWKGRLSMPYWFRVPMRPGIRKVAANRYSTRVGAKSPGHSLSGRVLVLQRLSQSGWVDVRRARLRRIDAWRFGATFLVSTPGLTLRVLAPRRTARPCYNAGASAIFRS